MKSLVPMIALLVVLATGYSNTWAEEPAGSAGQDTVCLSARLGTAREYEKLFDQHRAAGRTHLHVVDGTILCAW